MLHLSQVLNDLDVPCGQPEDVAGLVHYLLSPESAFLTGQAINLCGGLSAGLSTALWDKLAGAEPAG